MTKIRCNLEKKDLLLDKGNTMVDNIKNIKIYYDNINIPLDLEEKYLLENIKDLLIDCEKNIKLVNDALKYSFIQFESIQSDVLEKMMDISMDELPIFDGQIINDENF